MQLLQPFNGVFPSDNAQYSALTTQLRRMGHIIERAPGNLATQLRSTHGGTAQRQFLTGVTNAPPQQDSEWASAFAVTQQQPLQAYWAGQPGAHAAHAPATSYAGQAQAYPSFEDEDHST